MTTNAHTETIASAIADLYDQAGIPFPTRERPIAPLGELVGSLNLTWQELPALTSATAMTFLRDRTGAIEEPQRLTEERLAGFLYATPRYGNIFVEQEDSVARRRFSIAHELGHYLLHIRPYFEAHMRDMHNDVSARLGAVEALPTDQAQDEDAIPLQGQLMLPDESINRHQGAATTETQRRVEDEANLFAAELLMPGDVVAALGRRYGEEMGMADGDLSRRVGLDLLVSQAAIKRRLLELGLQFSRRRTGVFDSADATNFQN